MKKIVSIITIILTAAIVLMACGSKIPDTMTKETYDNGTRALEVMEKYINFEVDKNEAETRLHSLKDALEKEREGMDDVIKSSDNLLVSVSITQYIQAMDGVGSVSIYDVAEELRGYLKP